MLKRKESKAPVRIDRKSREAKRLLVQGLGDAQPSIIIKLLAVVFLVNWSADTLFHRLMSLRELMAANTLQSTLWLYDLSPLLLLLLLVWFLQRKARQNVQSFDVVVNTHIPQPHRDLAIFVSPVKHPEETSPESLPPSMEDIVPQQYAAFFQWRMPLETLKAQCQAGELERVWLVGSRGDQGSVKQLEAFKQLAHHYLGEQLASVSFPALTELEALSKPKERMDPPRRVLDEGVDEGNIAQVARLVDRLRQYTYHQYGTDDLVVDVTGMTVPASIGGVIACLGQGQSFIYTNTRNYQVREYDMAYEADDA